MNISEAILNEVKCECTHGPALHGPGGCRGHLPRVYPDEIRPDENLECTCVEYRPIQENP